MNNTACLESNRIVCFYRAYTILPPDTDELSAAQARLLNTARELFCREGIQASGISKIIKHANVARRLIN